MKRTVRKWLSLLMAFAIVLSLMPVALAEDGNTQDPPSTVEKGGTTPSNDPNDNTGTGGGNTGTGGGNTGTGGGNTGTGDGNTGTGDGNTGTGDGNTGTGDGNTGTGDGNTGTGDGNTGGDGDKKHEHTLSEKYGSNDEQHWKECTAKDCTVEDKKVGAENHKFGDKYQTSNTQHWQECSVCEYETSKNDHNYEDGACVCGKQDPKNEIEVTLSKASYTGSGTIYIEGNSILLKTDLVVKKGGDTLSASEYEVSYGWYSSKLDVEKTKDSSAYVYNSNKAISNASVKCEVTVGYNNKTYSAEVEWSNITNTGNYDGDVSVTIYGDTTYYLGDKDDKGGKSVIDQIDDYINDEDGGYLSKIKFSNVTDTAGDLDASTSKWYKSDDAEEIAFEPEKSGTAEFEYRATSSRDNDYYGTISIKVENGSSASGDIEYNATAGKDVSFDADDFEDFWSDNRRKGSREDLDYVTFSLPSSSTGVLYDGDGSKLKSSTKCYVSAGRNETDLDDVYFEPKSSKAGTVRINFSAYGEDDTKISGTVVITYLNGNIDDITYTTNSSGKVDLKAKDFTDVFKAATGSSSSSLTITFTSLPSNGTLTYGSKDTKVTKSTTFKTSGTGNKIADVTYTASGSKSDTVTYTAASGSTKITGKILFNSVAANISLTVPYTCTSASGITFSTGDFTSRASGLTGSHSLAFGQPSGGNGGLYYTAIASQIPAGTKIPVSTLNTVTYRPASNGTTTIAFIIYDASGLVAGSGSVTITVSGVTGGTTNPGNPGTTTPGGVDSFKDVGATAWYRTDLTRLVSLGIMAGRSPNKFAPEGTLNYGEALKLICKAVGVTQPEGSGAQWAVNYKSYAVSQGWITSDVVLTDTITRTAIAQIGAKALGLSASSATPFPDTNDPYVAAMNTAGIILGNPDGNFNGSGNLKRSEICAIICRMLNYRDNAYNDQIPGWL